MSEDPRVEPVRLGFLEPRPTSPVGGVQRFAQALRRALETRCDLRPIHPFVQGRRGRFAELLRAVREERRPDAFDAIFHSYPTLPRVSAVPTFGYVHDLRSWGWHDGRQGRVTDPRRWLWPRVWQTWDAILVPTEHVARDVRHLVSRSPIHVVPEGIDHLPVDGGEPLAIGRPYIVVLGGRSPHKRTALGVDGALRAARRLGVEVVLIGGRGGARTSPGLTIAPPLDDASYARAFREAELCVAPSAYEGFGLAIGESLQAGTGVVYTDDCPVHALVGDAGWRAAPNADSIGRALEDAWPLRHVLGERGRAVGERYAWAATADRLLAIVAARRGHARHPHPEET